MAGVIAKESFRGTVVTYLGVLVGFVTTFFVLTQFLTAEEIGLSRVLIDAATLLASLSQLGTNASIVRFFPYFRTGSRSEANSREEIGDHGLFFWTIVIPLIGFGLFGLLFWAAADPLKAWFGQKSPLFVSYFYFVLPMAFFYLYQAVMETNAIVRQHVVVPRAVKELVVRLGLLAIYLLYSFRILSMDGFVIAICANYGFCALINTCYLFTLGEVDMRPDWTFLRQNPDLVRKYLRYTGFLIISALASVLAPTLSSFFVTAQMGLSYAGVFAIATYMAALVSIPSRSMNAIVSPQLSEAIKNEDIARITHLQQQVSNVLLLVGAMILMAIWLNIDLIFHVLPNGADYADARNVVLLLGLGQLFVTAFSVSVNVLNYSRYYAWSLLLSLFLTGSGIVLNNRLIPILGIDGAAWAMMVSETLYYVLAVWVVHRTVRSNPLCVGQLKTILIVVGLILLNVLWQHLLPMGIWVSSIARTIVLGGCATWIAYKWAISPELNDVLDKLTIRKNP